MSEDKAFDYSTGIDQKSKPVRIRTKRAWFISLLLPVLSILASAVYLIMGLVFSAGYNILVAVFGLICGGIVPTVMIVRGKIDTSIFFLGKMILFAVQVVVGVLTWTVFLPAWDIPATLFFPVLMIIPEIIFAAVQKTDFITKICLALSSLVWAYLGFLLELLIGVEHVTIY